MTRRLGDTGTRRVIEAQNLGGLCKQDLVLDVEPKGRISSAFEAIEENLDEIKSRITRLEQNTEHRFNRLDAKLEVIIEHLTGVNDLPEE